MAEEKEDRRKEEGWEVDENENGMDEGRRKGRQKKEIATEGRIEERHIGQFQCKEWEGRRRKGILHPP